MISVMFSNWCGVVFLCSMCFEMICVIIILISVSVCILVVVVSVKFMN